MPELKDSELTRRRFLRASLVGASALSAGFPGEAPGLDRDLPADPAKRSGRTLFETGPYGSRSDFATEGRVAMTRNGVTGGSFTPIQHGRGIVTPSGLHYEVHHNGCPTIDPAAHRLLVHGMVKTSKVFTIEDLLRFPSVTRFQFLECAGNTWAEWEKPSGKDVQWTHGLMSTSEWTGVPVATILREVDVRGDAKWILAEGGDGAGLMRSIPIEKAWDDAMLVYGQNGEAMRPEQGFPLRLLVPGYEGNMNIKWLRRLEIGDRPWWTHSEVTEYADPMPDGRTRILSFEMERIGEGAARGDLDRRWRTLDRSQTPNPRALKMPHEVSFPVDLGRKSNGASEPRDRSDRVRPADAGCAPQSPTRPRCQSQQCDPELEGGSRRAGDQCTSRLGSES